MVPGLGIALSRFQPESELSKFNRASGMPFPVSDVLWDALQASLEAARFSDGLVTPTLTPWLEATGYDRSFEAVADLAASPATALAPPAHACGAELKLDAHHRCVTLPVGCGLDLGGTAKGWAADRAARRLRALGPCLVDAGGDIAVYGPRLDGSGWAVGISDPFHPGKSLELLGLTRGAVATSGRDYHRWMRQGASQHHIIDPRTGLPASTDVLTATVVASSTVEAEVGGEGGADPGQRCRPRMAGGPPAARRAACSRGRLRPAQPAAVPIHLEVDRHVWSNASPRR